MDVAELSARAEITDLVARYSRAVDSRAWDDFDDLFDPGAIVDYRATGGMIGGPAEAKSYLSETLVLFRATQHLMGLPVIMVAGDTAEAVVPCHNPMVLQDGRLLVCSLRYRQRFARTATGWRITSLEQEKVHMGFVPGEEF